jgi:hypothetical protein
VANRFLLNFITSARPVIYNALMKDGNKYVNATITLHDDDGTGTDEIKIVVSGLDFSSLLIFLLCNVILDFKSSRFAHFWAINISVSTVSRTSVEAIAPYLLQTNLLNTLKYTDEQRQIVIGHQDNYSAYYRALINAKVERATRKEVQRQARETLSYRDRLIY